MSQQCRTGVAPEGFLSRRDGCVLYPGMQAGPADASVHFVVAVPPATWRERDHEYMMACLGSAVVENTFHRKKRLFGRIEIVIVIGASGTDDSLTYMTFGLERYALPELHVTAPRDRDALAFLYCVAHWMLVDPERPLQDGDTVGRSDDERISVVLDRGLMRLELP